MRKLLPRGKRQGMSSSITLATPVLHSWHTAPLSTSRAAHTPHAHVWPHGARMCEASPSMQTFHDRRTRGGFHDGRAHVA